MTIKSKYKLMADSSVTDSNGLAYPDLATFPINDFSYNIHPITHTLTYNETQRFFDLMQTYYSSFDFYDDFILWMNNIPLIVDSNETFNKEITLYDPSDINTWYNANLQ